MGGAVGGVLLTPGTALAATLPTTTAVSATQTPDFFGATLHVSVSVSAGSTNPSPTGTVSVTGAGGGCTATLATGTGGTSTGSCDIDHVGDGTYTLTATYADNTAFTGSSAQTTVVVGQPDFAPVFDAASPSLTATAGDDYSYTFHANGGHITYSLSTSADWLSIDSYSGTVSGTVPSYGASSFSYSVTAKNSAGSATAGPFWVNVTPQFRHHHGHANLATNLSCTSPVFTGQRGTCTLWVTNRGFGGYNSFTSASNVIAQIALPSQLRADFCGYFFNFGCRIFGNTAFQNLGTIYPGQTKSLTVTFTARSGFGLFGWHHGFRFTVKVVGSATSFGDFFGFFGHRQSVSVAYVTIIPRGHWW